MGEQHGLEALGVFGEWIWGDDAEKAVFAQAFGDSKTLIFRFVVDDTQPQSIATRVVYYFHGLEINGTSARFSDRASMRMEIWSAIAKVWAECGNKPTVEDPDVIIDVYEARPSVGPSQILWRIYHEVDLFNNYISLLLPADQLSVKQPIDTVDFKNLIRQHQLGGRGCTTLVHIPSSPQPSLCLKGLTLGPFCSVMKADTFKKKSKYSIDQ